MRPRRLLALLLWPLLGQAGPVSVVGNEAGPLELRLALTDTAVLEASSPIPCCHVAADAIARDSAANLQWIATHDGSAAALRRYNAIGSETVVVLDAGVEQILGLGFDAQLGELVALQRLNDNSLRVQRFVAATGAAIDVRAVDSSVSPVLAGSVAWSSTRRAFVLIANGQVWTVPALAADSSLALVFPDTDQSIQTLAIDPDDDRTYALVHDSSLSETRLHQLSGGVLQAFALGEANCCHVLASRSVIEPGQQFLYAYTRGNGATSFELRRFSLTDGAVSLLANTTQSAGLTSDASIPNTIGVLFLDGFE